jgi:putative cell wall-binding protein
MRRATLAALGVALTVGAGMSPATAAPSAPDDSDALVKALTSSVRNTGGAHVAPSRAQTVPDVGNALPSDEYFRIAGSNRYATAVEVSSFMVCSPTTATVDCDADGYPLGGVDNPVTTVFVANGLDFPDALGAGPLAMGIGPLLLVPPTGTVPTVVKNELARIDPTEIVIFGGTGAVSASVEAQLSAYGTTFRIAGANRYETAAEATRINDEIWRDQDGDDVDDLPDGHGLDTVVLASGLGFADALSGGGAASNSRGSLMLTAKSSLPAATKSALQDIAAMPRPVGAAPMRVIILGGTGVITASVESAVKAAVPGATVTRAAGSDRFGTAIALSKKVFPTTASEVFVVNGFNFPDALASAPLAGLWGASTLLAKKDCTTSGTRAEASRLDPSYVTGFGGEGVLAVEAIFLDVC